MKKIKVLLNSSKWNRLVEFEYKPGYVFTRDFSCEDYDWLVVFDEMPMKRVDLSCPPENTILCTWEPVTIKSYSRAYTRQFGHFLSNRPQEAEEHPNYRLGRGYFRWFVGRTYPEVVKTTIPPKSKLISVACSSKRMRHTAHDLRFKTVEAIAEKIPELEWFGHGVRPFDRKFEVLDPYKYHLAIENHIGVHHWTEKIADAWLCECLPFYAGDPDLAKVFPEESFIPIPIDNPEEAVRIVKAAISANEYEKRRDAVLEAKRLVLTKYNFWAQIIEVIEGSDGVPVNGCAQCKRIYSRRELRKHSCSAALEDMCLHLRRFWGSCG